MRSIHENTLPNIAVVGKHILGQKIHKRLKPIKVIPETLVKNVTDHWAQRNRQKNRERRPKLHEAFIFDGLSEIFKLDQFVSLGFSSAVLGKLHLVHLDDVALDLGRQSPERQEAFFGSDISEQLDTQGLPI